MNIKELEDVVLAFLKKPVDIGSGRVEILAFMPDDVTEEIVDNRLFVAYMEHNHMELSEEVWRRLPKETEN